MATHSEALGGSASLCDLLFHGLSAKIPRLQRKMLQKSCAIYQEGSTTFAYVYHRKNSGAVEIWCRGNVGRLRACTGVAFRERHKQGDVWADFPGRFEISSPNEVEAALRCLVEEAYPASRPTPFLDRAERKGETNVLEIPSQLRDLVERLGRGEKLKRRPVMVLLSWFDVEKRGKVVTPKIRAALHALGLETDPDFTEGGVNDLISFRLIDGAGAATSSAVPTDNHEPDQVEPKPETTADATTVQTSAPSDALSDDFLEPEEDEQLDVPDDRPVVSKPADWTITTLREKWEDGRLDLQPQFQREYVWRLKPELPSRLIESVLLEIPIPPLYFGRLRGGKLEVIDGQQRLTTLINFITNKFPLQRLTRMPSLNGRTFRELSTEYQEKIKDTPIRTVEIDAGSNTALRYEIFERLNRGSMALNEQELRNCVYRGKFNDLLAELETDAKWRSVKGGDTPEPRFKEREMILRFLAFANRIQFYKGGLKRFLNDYMAKYAPSDAAAIDEQARMFRQTMQNVYTAFGANAGRLYSISAGDQNGRWDTKFSIAALEIQASALLGQDPARVQKVADQIREHFLFLLLTDKAVQDAISLATGGSVPTKLRWSAFKSVIQPLLDNVVVEPRFFGYEFRKRLYDGNPVCALCKNRIHSFEDSTVDHIIPYSKNGKTVPANAQLSHRSCNAIKNATVPADMSEAE